MTQRERILARRCATNSLRSLCRVVSILYRKGLRRDDDVLAQAAQSFGHEVCRPRIYGAYDPDQRGSR